MSRSPSIPVRDAAISVARLLIDAGYESYFAGGCVRDRLLGDEPKDYDIATAATPDDVRRIFPRAQGVGESFGVMLVRHGGHVFEVATFRSDGVYHDGRRPSEVRFTDARADAERRDFTINGLFEHPITGAIVDFVEGERDLRDRVIRAIGDPDARFAEDHLRLLRAVRFAARYQCALDPRTSEAMRSHAPKLALIARERIGGELRRMLALPSRATAIGLLEAHGLDAPTLREPSRIDRPGDGRTSHLRRLRALPDEAPVTAGLAAWWLDRRESGIDSLLERWRDALNLSNEEDEGASAIVKARESAMAGWLGWPEAARKRWAAHAASPWAALLLPFDAPDIAREIRDWLGRTDPATIAPPPILSGNHLIAAGYQPSPRFRTFLDAAYDAQLEGRIHTVDEALQLVRSLAP